MDNCLDNSSKLIQCSNQTTSRLSRLPVVLWLINKLRSLFFGGNSYSFGNSSMSKYTHCHLGSGVVSLPHSINNYNENFYFIKLGFGINQKFYVLCKEQLWGGKYFLWQLSLSYKCEQSLVHYRYFHSNAVLCASVQKKTKCFHGLFVPVLTGIWSR